MRFGTSALALLALSACTTAGPKDAAPGPLAPTCHAEHAQGFVGKSADIADQARTAAGAAKVRVIRPGTAVTMDYRGDRLNLKTDDAGTILAVNCG